MIVKIYLSLSLTFFVFVSGIPGQSIDSIDSFILKEMDQRKIPGLSIAIIQNGQLYARLQGNSYREPSLRRRPDLICDRFFLREVEAHYQFLREEGQVTSLIFSQGRTSISAIRKSVPLEKCVVHMPE